MQSNSKTNRPGVRGFALLITLSFLLVSLLVFVSILYWATSNGTVTARNNQYNMSENAAEAAVERVIGQLDRDFVSLSISNSSAYYASLPATLDQSTWPTQYTYSDTNGNPNVISVLFGPPASSTVPLNSQFAGLYGLAQNVDVYATATPVGRTYNVPATVHESLQFANIPLYQFAIFYNVNLEICPGAAMLITGPVFCNQSIWEGANNATFSSTVTAVGTNCSLASDPFASNYAPQTPPAVFSMAGQPVNNANALVMPIGTNNSPQAILGLLNLPPPAYAMGTAAAYSSNGIVYPANGADLVITNFASGTNDGIYLPTGTNLIVYYQDSSLTRLPYDFYIMTNRGAGTTYATNVVTTNFTANVIFAGFSWVTNVAFYDWREGWNGGSGPPKRVEVVQIDIAKFNKWMTNTARNGGSDSQGVNPDPTKLMHSGHHLDSIYVYDSVPLTSSQLPAVRVVNGAQLPSSAGFTVATPFPIYVWGNYNSQIPGAGGPVMSLGTNNTANTYPAALMGDSITVLSTNWNDSYTNKLPTGTHGASSTTVNAAMLEGIVQSNPAISGNYSGGVENFMRLLEDWGSGVPSGKQTLTYNGSIVVLFYSQWATNSWIQTGNYYNPPTRNWAFDLNFQQASKLPPLTPAIKAMIRGNWFAHQ